MIVRLQAGYGERTTLEQVDFELGAGEALGLVGSSGAGKSTLVLALLGLLPWRGGWARGEVMLGGRNLLAMGEAEARRVRGKEIALVPQSPMSALNPAVSLQAHFDEAWRAHERDGRTLAARLAVLLPQVQLADDPAWLKRKPGAISVGQAQRVMIALALLHQPAVVVADEPTSALDPVTQVEILKLLRSLTRESGTSLLYISHDLVSVLQLCDRLAVLAGGRLEETLACADVGHGARGPALTALLAALPVPVDVLLAHRRAV